MLDALQHELDQICKETYAYVSTYEMYTTRYSIAPTVVLVEAL